MVDVPLFPRLYLLRHATSLDLPAPSANVPRAKSSDLIIFPPISTLRDPVIHIPRPLSRFPSRPRTSSISPHLRSASSTFLSARFRQFISRPFSTLHELPRSIPRCSLIFLVAVKFLTVFCFFQPDQRTSFVIHLLNQLFLTRINRRQSQLTF
jgi:hypothetical protein